MLGVHFHVASPEAYQLPGEAVQEATSRARHGARLRLFNEAVDASRRGRRGLYRHLGFNGPGIGIRRQAEGIVPYPGQ